jgi:hypothetical protein
MKRQTRDGSWHEFSSDEEALRRRLIDGGAPLNEVNDYVLCERKLAEAKAHAEPYYDYDRQAWVNV